MGRLEKKSRERANKENLQKALLMSIGAVGVISVALIAPNVLKLLPRTFVNPRPRIRRSLAGLKHAGLVAFEKTARGTYLRITSAGRLALARLCANTANTKRRWDRKWRVVMYDVREPKKRLRARVREFLRAYGFMRLQDSVWVYPYDCEDVVTLMKANFRMGREVLYMIVDSIENDGWIRLHFKLPAEGR
ncbi:CRISPR-associated endonuclease Cas2 [Candidatus Parcubacteria bacterium]|nr:CRISPR-associated endonuclease Cas2 [Candidatus Parcubacteria bacterium]